MSQAMTEAEFLVEERLAIIEEGCGVGPLKARQMEREQRAEARRREGLTAKGAKDAKPRGRVF